MIRDELIIEFTERHFPNEARLIETSLINYYYIKNKSNKQEWEVSVGENLLNAVKAIFEYMSADMDNYLGLGEGPIYQKLCEIHIKT